MKIALVHDWLTGMRGGEKCLEVLCRRFPQAELFTLLRSPGATSPAIERMQIRTSFLQRVPGVAERYRYLLPLMPTAIEHLKLPHDLDLVVSFSHAVAKSIPIPPGVPHVCYCFTPMRYAWHLRDQYVAPLETSGTGRVFSARLVQTSFAKAKSLVLDRLQQWDRKTSNRVTHFIAISRTIAARIAESYGRESHIIYPPVDTQFYTPADVPRDDYYLCVSALVPYKRIDLAVAACRRLGRPLKVIGRGPELARLQRLAGGGVELLGWRSDEEVRDHLRRCRALLFPGHEDFGIVPLEAQACGTPVIALGRGGATETVLPGGPAGQGSGLFFDQPTVASLADAIVRFEQHPTWFCPSLARRQAERFGAERYERELIDYLDGVARQHRAAVVAPAV